MSRIPTYLISNNFAKIKTGTYTGDGSTGQSITGVGFQPKYVIIWDHPAAEQAYLRGEKVDQTWGDYNFQHLSSAGAAIQHYSYLNKINSLDADGFTVDDNGADQFPNANSATYDYVVFG
jgi:hypothetical protein